MRQNAAAAGTVRGCRPRQPPIALRRPRLLDFGVAKLLDDSVGELTAAAFTPSYAAPEQLQGGEVSTATDVYALGLLLYRLLAGALPATRSDPSLPAVPRGCTRRRRNSRAAPPPRTPPPCPTTRSG